MLCPTCGKEIPDDPVLCPRCGARLPRRKKVAALIPYRKGGKWGFCDRDRKTTIPASYDDARPFSEGFARIHLNEIWGFIDAKGNMVVPAIYDSVLPFGEGLAPVKHNGKYG